MPTPLGVLSNIWALAEKATRSAMLFHPLDLARMVDLLLRTAGPRTRLNVSGGSTNSMSLAQLTACCDQPFGPHCPISDRSERTYDVPWLILDPSKTTST